MKRKKEQTHTIMSLLGLNKKKKKKDVKVKNKSNGMKDFVLFMLVVLLFLMCMPLIADMFNTAEHNNRINKIQENYEEDSYRIELMKSTLPSDIEGCVKGCEMVARKIMSGSTYGIDNFNSHKCYEYCLKGE